MRISAALRSDSIRRVLGVGFGMLILLLLLAGFVGFASISNLSDEVVRTFRHANEVTQQSSRFSRVITEEVQAATTYVSEGDQAAEADFQRLGLEAHGLHRSFTSKRSDLAGEVANTVLVDNRLAELENAFAIAHRLRDLGRVDEARDQARVARTQVSSLLSELQRADAANNLAFSNASEALSDHARKRSLLPTSRTTVTPYGMYCAAMCRR